jgi:hypothetical protein
MGSTGLSAPDETLDEFDDILWELQREEEIDRNESRSSIITGLMEEWIEEKHSEYPWLEERLEGNGNRTIAMAD